MEVQFKGGPWDGISIKTRILPDQVRLQYLTVELGAETRPAGEFPGDSCYWLRTPYNRDVYYEFETCGAEHPSSANSAPTSDFARLLAKRASRDR
jgi:hypothetical protein